MEQRTKVENEESIRSVVGPIAVNNQYQDSADQSEIDGGSRVVPVH